MTATLYRILLISLFLSTLRCTDRDMKVASIENSLFTLLTEAQTNIGFNNVVKDTKDFNIFTYRNFYNGGGVSIGDINNDGLPDIYFSANMDKNKLYLNKGNFTFEDITEKAGVAGSKSWSTGVTMADVNADGLLDIYVCNSGDVKGDNRENELYINNGDLTFTERAAEFGLNDTGYSTHASFFDYDGDGDLDCYILSNSFKSIERIEQFLVKREVRDPGGGHKLMRNDGDHFTDVSEQAGIYGSQIGFGLGVSASDLNEDMLPDLYVSNDFWERDYLYLNKGNGTFSEEITSRTSVISASSMGSDIADLDNDGYVDIFTTEMLPADNVRLKTMARFEETNIRELKEKASYHYQFMQNCLQFNDGHARFQELACLSNVEATDWSWGSLIFDMDNDGWKDIFVSNGIYRDITSMDFSDFVADRENIKKIVLEKGKFDFEDLLTLIPSSALSNYAFINQHGRIFKNIADSLGLGTPSFSNGAAYGDLDNDGDYDLVVNNINAPCFVYRNNSNRNSNGFLKIKFKGASKNPFGIGAKVTVYSQAAKQVQQNFMTRGFESSVEPQLLFGLNKVKTVDSLVVIWPDLKKQVLTNIKNNQVLILDHASANYTFSKEEKRTTALFHDITANVLNGNYIHKENGFNDFDHQRLLPRKISTEGPKILKGDMNGDKREDFILLGAAGDYDKIFFQNKEGVFFESMQAEFLKDSVCESTCGAVFDADQDGDLDIVIGSGGNFRPQDQQILELRYYENDGKGHFRKMENKFRNVIGNFSCIVPEDFDHDGDTDLFVGARVVPDSYGQIPRSFLLINEEKLWKDSTPEGLKHSGMITGAIWIDANKDGYKDLVVAGEWMPVTIFKNNGKALETAQPLPGTNGLWTAIEKVDINADGLEDIVLGNLGMNTKFRASRERPMKMYVKDFDDNGKSEFIINWYPPAEDRLYPFATKADMTGQMPVLKKRILKYSEYATKTYEDIFNDAQRKGALAFEVATLANIALISKGNLDYELRILPIEVQVSPVMAVLADDLNGDKIIDLFLCGNLYGLKPEMGRQDSNHGIVLKGDGHGKFVPLTNDETGIYLKGEVRDIEVIDAGSSKFILVAMNNAPAKVLKINRTATILH